MSTLTTNYKLLKPDLTDPADITKMNPNWDILDNKLKALDDTVNESPFYKKVQVESSAWEAVGSYNGLPYTAVIDVPGLTSNDIPIIDLLHICGDPETARAENEAFALIDQCSAGDGVINLHCWSGIPQTSIWIQIGVYK